MTELQADAMAYVRERAENAAFAVTLGADTPDPAERVRAMMPALIAHLAYLHGGDPSRAIRPDDLIAAYAAELARCAPMR